MPCHRFPPLLLAPSLLCACSEPTAPAPAGAPIQTDRPAYVAAYLGGEGVYRRYGFTVVATMHNSTAQTLYLGRCGPDSPHPVYSVLLADSSGPDAAAYDHGWACVGHDRQFVLRPGDARSDTLELQGPNAWDAAAQPLGALTGRFRLVYDVRTASGDGAPPTPDTLGRSNLFTVTVAP